LAPWRQEEIAKANAQLEELRLQEEKLREEMQQLDRSRYDWRRVALTGK
jgi:hypothetical protein